MPSLVTSRMYKNNVKRSPPEAGFQAINRVPLGMGVLLTIQGKYVHVRAKTVDISGHLPPPPN
jgi:hypothetical protein